MIQSVSHIARVVLRSLSSLLLGFGALGGAVDLASAADSKNVCAGGNNAQIIISDPGVQSSVWDDGSVSLMIPLQNDTARSLTKVSVEEIKVPSATYLGPNPLPAALGPMLPDAVLPVNARFTPTHLDSHAKYPIILRGTYQVESTVCPFNIQGFVTPIPPAIEPIVVNTITVDKATALTAFFPPTHAPPPPDAEFNGVGLPPPLGEPRYLFPTPPAASVLNRVLAFTPNDQTPPASGDPSAVVFLRNQNGGGYGGLPPDPSAAGADPSGFVLISANTAVSYSKDFGKHFTTQNLTSGAGFADPAITGRTDFFPENDGGLCCDQVIHYIPGRNIFVWLLQYWSPQITIAGTATTGQNRLRIAWATPQAATADFLHAWTWFDLTGADFGQAATDWMDYPDLAYSNNFLYISVDHGFVNSLNQQKVYTNRRYFVRMSLNDMLDTTKSSVGGNWIEPTKGSLVKNHIVQSSPDTMYFSAQPKTSQLSVFAWPDSSDTVPAPHDIDVSNWCASSGCDYSVLAPDNFNWNVAPLGALGATFVQASVFCPPSGCGDTPTRFLYFALSAGRDNTNGYRPFPYVRVAKIDADRFKLISELDIWNPGFAFATPALVSRNSPTAPRDEVAISLAVGGGGSYADNAVGFLGDFVAYVTTSSNSTQEVFTFDNSKPPKVNGNLVRYGDYFDVRNAIGPVTPAGQGVGYSTLGYGVNAVTPGQSCAAGGCNVNLQYVLFGRNADLFPTPSPPIK